MPTGAFKSLASSTPTPPEASNEAIEQLKAEHQEFIERITDSYESQLV
jgi:hypothetical protein